MLGLAEHIVRAQESILRTLRGRCADRRANKSNEPENIGGKMLAIFLILLAVDRIRMIYSDCAQPQIISILIFNKLSIRHHFKD